MDEWGIGGIYCQGKIKVLGENPVSVAHCPRQIPWTDLESNLGLHSNELPDPWHRCHQSGATVFECDSIKPAPFVVDIHGWQLARDKM